MATVSLVKRRRWEPAEIELLREELLRAQKRGRGTRRAAIGRVYERLGKLFGRSARAVLAEAFRRGFTAPRRLYTKEYLEELRQLRESGLTWAEVTGAVGRQDPANISRKMIEVYPGLRGVTRGKAGAASES